MTFTQLEQIECPKCKRPLFREPGGRYDHCLYNDCGWRNLEIYAYLPCKRLTHYPDKYCTEYKKLLDFINLAWDLDPTDG